MSLFWPKLGASLYLGQTHVQKGRRGKRMRPKKSARERERQHTTQNCSFFLILIPSLSAESATGEKREGKRGKRAEATTDIKAIDSPLPP